MSHSSISQNAGGRTWVAEIEQVMVKRIIGTMALWLVLDEAYIATLQFIQVSAAEVLPERL